MVGSNTVDHTPTKTANEVTSCPCFVSIYTLFWMHDGIRMPFLQAVCMAERHTMVVIDLYAELT